MPMFGLYIDPLYFIILAPGFLLAMWASVKVKSTFARYERVRSERGLTGARAAMEILRRNNLPDVRVEETGGFLSDHYDPRTKTVRLSPQVYRMPSAASVAVAAHEVGHALQHAKGYAPLALRSAAVPLARMGSWVPMILITVGFLMHMLTLVYAGVILFAGLAFFQLVTLPVELNASTPGARAAPRRRPGHQPRGRRGEEGPRRRRHDLRGRRGHLPAHPRLLPHALRDPGRTPRLNP